MGQPTSVDGIAAAPRQTGIKIDKITSRTTTGTQPFSIFDIAGNPGAGVLAGSNTANGYVPVDSDAGYPLIRAFPASTQGYITRVAYGWSVAGRLALYDRIFCAGAYSFNSNVTLASVPSFAGRVPGGTHFDNLEIWVENVTLATGNLDVRVNYLNEAGAPGDTGAIGVGAAPTVGRVWQLPLAVGDKGVSGITQVRGGTASVGTFNIMVLRKLWEGRCKFAGDGGLDNWMDTGMPEVFADSACYLMATPDSASTSQPAITFDISYF